MALMFYTRMVEIVPMVREKDVKKALVPMVFPRCLDLVVELILLTVLMTIVLMAQRYIGSMALMFGPRM